jgi:hypothetical protein
MTVPPFNELRLKPGEWPDQQRLEELFEGMVRNFEDLYNRFQTSQQSSETLNAFIRSAVSGNGHKVSWGLGTVTFTASKTSATTEITHGLTVEPFTVVATAKEAAGLIPAFSWSTPTKTKFSIRGELSGTATGAIPFTWFAIA